MITARRAIRKAAWSARRCSLRLFQTGSDVRRVSARRPGRSGRLAAVLGRAVEADPERLHGQGDVLDRLVAQVVEADRQLVAHLVVHWARDADAAGLRQRLEPRRD